MSNHIIDFVRDKSTIRYPSGVHEIDPMGRYNMSQLARIQLAKGRQLTEALRNDPLAPHPDTTSTKTGKVYTGQQLLDYIHEHMPQPSDLEARVSSRIADGIAKERAQLDKERAQLDEERQALRAVVSEARAAWRDDKLNDLRRTVVSSLTSDRIRISPMNPVVRQSGIYFLTHADQIVYVGQSVNMLQRVSQHTDKQFDRVIFFRCDQTELNEWEGLFIRLLQPRLNGGYDSRASSKKYAPISSLAQRLQTWTEEIDSLTDFQEGAFA